MTRVTHLNSMQFVRGAIHKTVMDEDNNFPAPYELCAAEGRPALECGFLAAEAFTILKLFPGVVHRGVANKDDYDRVVFFVSSNTVPIDIGEMGYQTMAEGARNGNALDADGAVVYAKQPDAAEAEREREKQAAQRKEGEEAEDAPQLRSSAHGEREAAALKQRKSAGAAKTA
jgi:hypothetical protein